MLQALKERFRAIALVILLLALPLSLVMPGLSWPRLILVTLALAWMWRQVRKIMARVATAALKRGASVRARRIYRILKITSLERLQRQSCRLSLAACDAADGRYSVARGSLAAIEGPREGALLAVALNLEAYCLARERRELDRALALIQEALALRPEVPGFKHTRGLVLLELGRWDESTRDLDATWYQLEGNHLLEAERCFDLGRLWSAQGQEDYASDYFSRAERQNPDSRWAAKARLRLKDRVLVDFPLA